MKIEKLKKLKSGKYKIEFEDHSSLNLYDEVILKNNLLFHKEVDDKLLNKLYDDNNRYDYYNKVLKYILYKMRSTYEIYEYMKKLNIPEDQQEEIIVKLKENNLLNDRLYVKSYISDKIHLTNNGPEKIKSELLKYNIEESLIEEELKNYDFQIFEDRIKKIISKKIVSNKKDSSYIIKQKLLGYLINLGYDREMILANINNLECNNSVAIKKEYDKLLKKLSKKYDGQELKYQIKNKLYQKGFSTEDINEVI